MAAVEASHADAGQNRTLLVSDDAKCRELLSRGLASRGALVTEVEDGAHALRCLDARGFDLVVVDERVDLGRGIGLLERMREAWPSVARALVARGDRSALTFEAVNRAGAVYVIHDASGQGVPDELLARTRSGRRNQAARSTPQQFPSIIGQSRAIQRVLELVARLASTDSTILVLGETGTGKDLIGRAIHDASSRASGPWCAVNSAAFPESLLESELFGHRRGSFTGATENSKGLFEQADGGTLFLDEVAEMPLSMQAKLLRFLQTGEVRAVGGTSTRRVDVRLVTATNKRLEREVEKRTFREDLYYRLAVIPIEVPPLRARIEDVPLLAAHFAQRVCARWGRPEVRLNPSALDALMSHTWPGNVRELENVVERAVALCPGDELCAEDLPSLGRKPEPERSSAGCVSESLPSLERRHILETLERVGWNRRRAAAVLQISTTTLWRRLKSFGIEGKGERDAWLNSSAS